MHVERRGRWACEQLTLPGVVSESVRMARHWESPAERFIAGIVAAWEGWAAAERIAHLNGESHEASRARLALWMASGGRDWR